MPRFAAGAKLEGIFGDGYARIIRLRRRKKNGCLLSVRVIGVGAAMTSAFSACATFRWPVCGSLSSASAGASGVRAAAECK